jgi:hypothetical protein
VAELRWPTVALDVEKNGQARTPPGPNARASRAAATWNSTMKMHVTHLQDAKASTGSPFDMKVTDRKFSREFNNHWDDLVIAQFEFVNFVFDCLEKKYSARRWEKVHRLLGDLTDVICCSEAYASRLRDATRSDQDNRERDILGVFLVHEGVPFLERWEEILIELDDGASLDIDQVSFWMLEDPGRNWRKF